MKRFIYLINIIIIIKVCLGTDINVTDTSFTIEECSNNLKFNLTIESSNNNIIKNVIGAFKNESNGNFTFKCKDQNTTIENLICEFDKQLENGNYTIIFLNYTINNTNYSANIDEIEDNTLNYAKNYAIIDEILTQNQTIYFDYSNTFKITFKTINVDNKNYKIDIKNIDNESENYSLNESNITCNLGIMYIKLNSKDFDYFDLKENDTKNFSVDITNPCGLKKKNIFKITLNRSCVNCIIESTNLSNENQNITNPFFDESFFIFKSKFYFFLNILILLFL